MENRTTVLKPTDTSDPSHYHRVVDCQWGCPAHTNVPEYIRLIANGHYTESYLLNRKSNVFPGILGRTCDRPLRARLPQGEARRRAGGDLPAQAGGVGPARRRHRVPADHPRGEERQADRVHRGGRGVAHRRQRPHAARLRGHDLREAGQARRAHVDQHPRVPSSRAGALGGDRLHRRHGRRSAPERPPSPVWPRCSRRTSTPSSSGRGRPRARSSTFPDAGTRSRSTSGSSGWSPSASGTSRAAATACW